MEGAAKAVTKLEFTVHQRTEIDFGLNRIAPIPSAVTLWSDVTISNSAKVSGGRAANHPIVLTYA